MGKLREEILLRFLGLKASWCRRIGVPMSFRHRRRTYWLNSDRAAAYHVAYSMEKLQRMVDLIPDAPSVVFDVGGNCGLFSALARQRFAHAEIHCFEPSPLLLPIIRRNCDTSVHLHNCAISDRSGEAVLFVNTESQQTNSLLSSAVDPFTTQAKIHRTPVACHTIDEVVRANGIAAIDVLKLDIQGAEAAALRGAQATLPRVKMIFIEATWLDPGSVANVVPFCRRAGFAHIGIVNAVHLGADLVLSRLPVPESGNLIGKFSLPPDDANQPWR